MTTEQVPIDWTCGEARVIDVRSLVGSTKQASWPASPEITVELGTDTFAALQQVIAKRLGAAIDELDQ